MAVLYPKSNLILLPTVASLLFLSGFSPTNDKPRPKQKQLNDSERPSPTNPIDAEAVTDPRATLSPKSGRKEKYHLSMAASSLLSLLSVFSLCLLASSSSSVAPEIKPITISIPLSPFFTKHPSSDPIKTLHTFASASLTRAHHLKHPKSKSSFGKTQVFPHSYGGYSISLGFGTPPQTLPFLLDTGSSLVWFPCTSRYICTNCAFPNVDPKNLPTFVPKLSSSSKIVGCENPKCAWIFGTSVQSRCHDCNPASKNCSQSCPLYMIEYGAGSTAGLLLSETLDFPVKTFPDFLVGAPFCRRANPPSSWALRRSRFPTIYLVPGADGHGGTVVDSGTTFTFMEKPVFETVAKAFETQMANYSRAVDIEAQSGLSPCFNIAGQKVVIPELTFEFKGGARFVFPFENYFALAGHRNAVCLTIFTDNTFGPGLSGGPAIIFGSFQQQNFYVEIRFGK
ncbi:Aspartic proteinase nepenthesin-1 [Morella rubra]|uniref:Aspartic proteinase nepenthesin-1 n=1 Tax=Morella rubra TaxID=262757 RepID=A0A6A1URJ9_9ROSI|nr:Aspartic proteinase nepenthesin-1 [Morella rubra]